jgi:hypothetical protein
MQLNKRSHSASGQMFVDEVFDGYVTWRTEALAVDAAYHQWTRAAPEDSSLAFAGYLAALDREALAADDYRRLVELSAST